MQSELLGVLTAANIAPNKARTNQLAEAIQKLFPNKNFTLTAGAGLTGGGDLSANRTIGLATPSTLSGSTANWSGNGTTGHTHEIAKATPTLAGVVKLVNALTSTATDAALTAAQGKVLAAGKLGNSGNQTLNGILTFNNPTTWAAWYATTRSGQWRFETNPVGDTAEGGKRFNFVFTGADNAEKARVAFPDPEGTQTVAYQSWVKEQIIGSDPVNRSGIDLDATTTPQFFINASNGYVSTVGTEHAGLVLGYRNDCTQLIAAGGNLWVRGSDNNPISDPSHWSPWRRLLDDGNGVMLTGDQTIAGTKTFSGSLKTASTITSGGDVVISNSNKTARFGMGASDCFIHNPTAKKYLQLKDNGELAYSDDKIILQSMTASTSAAGIVKLNDSVSSTSITEAATAKAVKTAWDKAVAALNAANANAVTGSMASTGYVRLPNGLILQWGVGDSAEDTGKINFPIAFPVALYMVNLSETHGGYSGNFYQPSWVRGDSTTAAFAYRSTGGIGLFSWFAIGR